MRREVLRATQSPMNARRWSLDLSCGHSVWVTSDGKPRKKREDCPKCEEERGEKREVGRGAREVKGPRA